MSKQSDRLGEKERDARSAIGRRVVYWALTSVTLLGVVAMAAAWSSADPASAVKDILAMLLPVTGAWIGTVLAFYFSRENYVAAAENSATMLSLTLDQRLRAIKVESVMIEIGTADKITTNDDEADIKLKDHILESDVVKKKDRNRILILNTSGVVRYLAHRSMFDKFIAEKALQSGATIATLTLKDMLDTNDYKDWISSFECVRPDTSLSDVKARMDSNPKCQDVIVTEDGKRSSSAKGWITNAIVLEKSRA